MNASGFHCKKPVLAFSFLMIFMLVMPRHGTAKEETIDDIWKGVENSFAFPFEEWSGSDGDIWSILSSEIKIENEFLLSKGINKRYHPVVDTEIKFTPLGCWFAEMSFFHYMQSEQRNSWDQDFVYRFGCEDWQLYALSLVYSNYAVNRSYADISEKYETGTYSLRWNFFVPDFLARPFLIETDKQIGSCMEILYSPRFINAEEETELNKLRLKATFSFPVYEGLYFIFSAYHYLSEGQQPWDPDYTCEFGWRGKDFAVFYKNYGGNRFPWRADLPHEGDFANGSIGIGLSWNWLEK